MRIFFLSRQKCRTGKIWAFCGMLPLFSLFPFSGCRSSSLLLPFFAFFSCLLFFGCRPSCEGRFLFFFFLSPQKKRKKTDVLLSFCPSFLRKGKKKLLSREEKKASRTIFLRRFYFSFSLFVSFSLSPPCPFPDGFPEEGNPSSLIRRLFHFGKRREKRKKKGFPCLFLHSGKTEERHAENKGRFRIQKRKRDGRRDGCSRHLLPMPAGRQNLACGSDFRKEGSKVYCVRRKVGRRMPAHSRVCSRGMQEGRISHMTAVFAQRRSIHHAWKKNAQKANFGRSWRYVILLLFLGEE